MKNIITFVIVPSSLLAKKREIIGDVLSKLHPMPKGRVLKTICCSNIPKFVPKNIESKNLFWSFLSNFLKKKFILNFFIVIKNIIAPSNLISVVWKGDRLLSMNTIRDKRPPNTAHKTDKKGKI